MNIFEVQSVVKGYCLTNRFTDKRWQYGIKPASIDVDDKTVVEIYESVEDGERLIATLSSVVRVGDVCAETTLNHPVKVITRCPRCSFIDKQS